MTDSRPANLLNRGDFQMNVNDVIRELTNLTWESVGKQQDIAQDYLLAAQKEAIATLQTLAKRNVQTIAELPEEF